MIRFAMGVLLSVVQIRIAWLSDDVTLSEPEAPADAFGRARVNQVDLRLRRNMSGPTAATAAVLAGLRFVVDCVAPLGLGVYAIWL